MDEDDEVSRILARTRARRQKQAKIFNDSPRNRSPLKEKNEDYSSRKESRFSKEEGPMSSMTQVKKTEMNKSIGKDEISEERITTTITTTTTITESESEKRSFISNKNSLGNELDENLESGRKKRLAGLAKKFQEMENEILPKMQIEESGEKKNNYINDTDLLSNLKAQGFTETSSKSKLIYDFASPVKAHVFLSPSKISSPNKAKLSSFTASPNKVLVGSPSKVRFPPTSSPVKAHQFISPSKNLPSSVPPKPTRSFGLSSERTDTASRRTLTEKVTLFNQSPKNSGVDPALLSLKDRKALFEKNKTVPTPIARFGESVTPAMLQKSSNEEFKKNKKEKEMQSFVSTAKSYDEEKESKKRKVSLEIDKQDKMIEKQRETNLDKKEVIIKEKRKSTELSPSRKSKEPDKRHKGEPSPKDDSFDLSKEETLKEKCNKGFLSNDTFKTSVESHEYYPGVHSLKKIKISPLKSGALYPNLDDIEVSSSCDHHSSSPGETLSESSLQREYEIDELLDEAYEDSFEEPNPLFLHQKNPSPSMSTSSWEFTNSGSHDFKTPFPHGESSSPIALPQVEGVNDNLFHTVSFYRKEKAPGFNLKASSSSSSEKDSSRQFSLNDDNFRHSDEYNDAKDDDSKDLELSRKDIQNRIRSLMNDAFEQEQRMEQASKALNYCVSKDEFEGSYERVEGERLLLEAFHKHSANHAEIQRLKTEGVMGKGSLTHKDSKGSVSLSEISLPLKNDFMKLLQSGNDNYVHYFVCLVKFRNQVIATQMLSSVDGIHRNELRFPNLINIRDLELDFNIDLEVYGLQTFKEVFTHEDKYHIKKDKSRFNLTPLKKYKKAQGGESRYTSGGGSRFSNPVNSKTIRRPSFGKVGHTTISIETIRSQSFSLKNVPSISPLDGKLKMKLSAHLESHSEQRGFLTIFNDVNGFGDWSRRWCLLSGNSLRFWKYPEDELKSEPIFDISLASCITEIVTLAPKEICSRRHTFMLESQRKMKSLDRNSLVMHLHSKSGITKLRHLLMADTREERISWCGVLNRALENYRAWDPSFSRPRSDSLCSSLASNSE